MSRISLNVCLLTLIASWEFCDAYVSPSSPSVLRPPDAQKKPCGDMTNLGSLEVPSLGIGTIAWSSNNFFSLENQELQDTVTSALNSNVAFFDTAERYGSHLKTALGMGYGETEEMINQFTAQASIESELHGTTKPIVATKFTPTPWRGTAQSVVDACEQSRRNLGVEQIDLYQIHMPDIVQPLRFIGKDRSKDREYWDGLAECYNRGLVKNVGVCNYGPTLVEECQEFLAKKGIPLASNQIGYSLLGRHNGAQETVDRCNELDVKVLAYFPFAMGLLTGKYSSLSMNDSKISRRSDLEMRDLQRYVQGDGGDIPEGGISPLLVEMEAVAEKRGKSVAQVALNYIISKGAIPIPGCRSASQLDDNIGALGWRLSETELQLLERAADKLGFGFDGAGFKRTSEKFVGYGVEKFCLD